MCPHPLGSFKTVPVKDVNGEDKVAGKIGLGPGTPVDGVQDVAREPLLSNSHLHLPS